MSVKQIIQFLCVISSVALLPAQAAFSSIHGASVSLSLNLSRGDLNHINVVARIDNASNVAIDVDQNSIRYFSRRDAADEFSAIDPYANCPRLVTRSSGYTLSTNGKTIADVEMSPEPYTTTPPKLPVLALAAHTASTVGYMQDINKRCDYTLGFRGDVYATIEWTTRAQALGGRDAAHESASSIYTIH